jgi:hypothetical protein
MTNFARTGTYNVLSNFQNPKDMINNSSIITEVNKTTATAEGSPLHSSDFLLIHDRVNFLGYS